MRGETHLFRRLTPYGTLGLVPLIRLLHALYLLLSTPIDGGGSLACGCLEKRIDNVAADGFVKRVLGTSRNTDKITGVS